MMFRSSNEYSDEILIERARAKVAPLLERLRLERLEAARQREAAR